MEFDMSRVSFAPILSSLFMSIFAALPPGFAQDDKFAKCADPEAAKRYVEVCLAENPYNTRETCEQRALEKACAPKGSAKKDQPTR